MMYLSWKATAAAALAVYAALAVSAAGVQAEDSACKGLVEDSCKTQSTCSWVKAYKTTKGREVAAFCRKKPERNKSTSAAVAPKS